MIAVEFSEAEATALLVALSPHEAMTEAERLAAESARERVGKALAVERGPGGDLAGRGVSREVPTCEDCGSAVQGVPGTWHEVLGWEQDRGSTGGANYIAARRRTDRKLCNACMSARKSGLHRDQAAML